MARPPKPTSILKAQGTFRPCRHADRPENAENPPPIKPPWIKGSAADAWAEIVATLPAGVLDVSDTCILGGACRWWSLWRKFDAELETGAGNPYKTVLLATMAWKNFDKAASKLGLSPTDRARLHIVHKEPEVPQPKARFFKENTG